MISMLSEGFWGEKLYAAMAAMRFAEISECRMNQIKFERNHVLTFHKAIVREYDGKVLSPFFADHLSVESLECSVA